MKKLNQLHIFYFIIVLLILVIWIFFLPTQDINVDCHDSETAIKAETLRIRFNDLIDNLEEGKYITEQTVEDVYEEPEEESKYLNLFDDGRSVENDLYCVSGVGESDGGYKELIGYYLTKDGIKYKNPVVADVWLEEKKGGYGCLVANMRVGYCSYLPEITMNDNRPGMVGGDISSEFSDDALEARYRADRKSTYYYCDELSEVQKYNQEYSILNVMNKYNTILK